MAESLLSQCWNEAVTRMLGRISVRCGLISQGSWLGTERLLCHCHTAAAGWLASAKHKGKRMKPSMGISRKLGSVRAGLDGEVGARVGAGAYVSR